MLKGLATVGMVLLATVLPAKATLIDHGISYEVQFISVTGGNTINMNLHVSGINAAADTEGGRYGIESFAFTQPIGFISATGPAGFVTEVGGLNASGCNGSGNFFCFNGPTPLGPALPANSILDLPFSITVGNLFTAFANDAYDPSFKVNWEGTQNNYDLVSREIGAFPTGTTFAVPGPLVGAGLPGLIALLGMLWFARKRGSVFC